MTKKDIPTTPEAKFAAAVQAAVDQALRNRRFVVPMFTADPPETDPTNLWMRYDGRLRGRYPNGSGFTYVDYPMRSDITSPPAVPAYPSAPAQAAAPQTYRVTWPATWSQSYQGSGAKRTDTIGETALVWGTDPGGTFGQQKALAGFDYASIVTALTGSTILKVELTITLMAAYWNQGVQVYYGMHNQTAEPTTYDASTTLLRYGYTETYSVGAGATTALPIAFAQQLRAGTAKGLVFEVPSADKSFYGYAAGVGSGPPSPQLTITYAK